MIKSLSIKITNGLLNKKIIEEKDKIKIIFGLEVIISTSIQIIWLISIGLILNCLIEIILFSIGFCTIRIFAGGYHTKTFFKCLILSTTVILLGITIAVKSNNQNNPSIYISLIIINLIIFLLLAPKSKRHKSAKKKIKYKITSIIAIIIINLITFVLWKSNVLQIKFLYIIQTGILFEGFTLIISYIKDRIPLSMYEPEVPEDM